ncbi:MFS transporter [Actinoplanes sp. NPDC051411]|uniref:MFS transporter n=1 Tax=Actinoplanes sp. NPDC051411 TaxID=3155522 RepID=UPI00343CE03B
MSQPPGNPAAGPDPVGAPARAESTARQVRRRLGIRRERVQQSFLATGAMFFFTGAVFGTWAGRIPSFKEDLHLTNGQLAAAFVSLEAAAVAGLQLGGFLVPKISSRRALTWALPTFGLALAVLGTVPNLVLLALVLAVMGIANSVVDVAINATGVAVQHLSGRSLMSRLHAMHSIGGIAGAGAGAGAALAALKVSRAGHFLPVGVLIAIGAVLASRRLLPPEIEKRADTITTRPVAGWRGGWSRQLVIIGVVAFCLTFTEGGANNWSAVYLREDLSVGAGPAAVAVAAFLAAMTAGRLIGDRLLTRFGPATVFRAAVLVAGLGFGAAVALDHPIAGFTGLILLGLGLSVTLPVTISAAGSLPGLAMATAVSRVSTMGYLGSFVAPAVIGTFAGLLTLGWALAGTAILVLLTFPAARLLSQATPESRAAD